MKVEYFSRITLLDILELLCASKKEDYCFAHKWRGFQSDFPLKCDFRRITPSHIPKELQNLFCWLEWHWQVSFPLVCNIKKAKVKKQAALQGRKRSCNWFLGAVQTLQSTSRLIKGVCIFMEMKIKAQHNWFFQTVPGCCLGHESLCATILPTKVKFNQTKSQCC